MSRSFPRPVFRACLLLGALVCAAVAFVSCGKKLPQAEEQHSKPKKHKVVEASPAPAPESAQIHAEFVKWMDTLPVEERNWQGVVLQNLGKVNRLIYERERMAGKATEYDFAPDDPKLPRLLLIGDSISCGYTLPARRALAGKVNVHRAPENCGAAANGVKKLDAWLSLQKWDIIHFNFGIHDVTTSATEYEAQLEQIATRLKATGARIIWASTTPIPSDYEGSPAAAEAIVERNAIAARIMQKLGIPTDDLFTFVTQHALQTRNPQDVHYNSEGYELLGHQVASFIESGLNPSSRQ